MAVYPSNRRVLSVFSAIDVRNLRNTWQQTEKKRGCSQSTLHDTSSFVFDTSLGTPDPTRDGASIYQD
jgi:hypothetical protein